MIARIWHGFTSINNADEYENMLRKDVLPGIGRVKGYKGAQLLRRNHPDEVEFITITYFDDMAAVIAFAGEDYTKAVIHPQAGKLLSHFDERSVHYNLVEMLLSDDFNKQ
ncbi:MAG: antibiotic biosynthesis monooxygenase [Flavisolibacter sp.]|nr:antibiotic biosynthesis monooxygenase [Flavisolibacter sp.]MBD0351296.1 antibiotic biosynthesis monooxygenase [Flavisolibacter sp.]